jgi:hypothetical protein
MKARVEWRRIVAYDPGRVCRKERAAFWIMAALYTAAVVLSIVRGVAP